MYSFEGKIAFVTGALGVIGKAYTKYLWLNNIQGIAHVDIQPDVTYEQELATKYGKNKNIFLKVNVGDKAELKAAFEATINHFGQLDIVINNAGIINEADYEKTLQINFMGAVHGTMMALKEYLPKYKKGRGVIINTSSMLAVFTDPYVPVYCLSKHANAAIGLNFADCSTCVDHDIRILTICPGPTASPLYQKGKDTHPERFTAEKKWSYPTSLSADYLGEGLIKIINEGANGAVWFFKEGREPHIIDYNRNVNLAREYLNN